MVRAEYQAAFGWRAVDHEKLHTKLNQNIDPSDFETAVTTG
jgi:hypothetical protein